MLMAFPKLVGLMLQKMYVIILKNMVKFWQLIGHMSIRLVKGKRLLQVYKMHSLQRHQILYQNGRILSVQIQKEECILKCQNHGKK